MTRRAALMSLVLSAFLAGCGGDGGPAPQETATVVPVDGEVDDPARMVEIYAAVVRQLVEEDNTLGGGGVPFRRLFIADGAVEDAADPQAGWNEVGAPFPPEVREGIEEALTDLPRVTFVRDPQSVVSGEEVCARVRGNGVLVSLGAIEGDGDRAEVPNELYLGCLGAQWLTYVVERSGDEWEVTGVTGPIERV